MPPIRLFRSVPVAEEVMIGRLILDKDMFERDGEVMGGEETGGVCAFISGEFIVDELRGGELMGGEWRGGEWSGGELIGGERRGGEHIDGVLINDELISGALIGGEVNRDCWYVGGGGDAVVEVYKIELEETDLGEDMGEVLGELDESLGEDMVPMTNGRSTIMNCDLLPSAVVYIPSCPNTCTRMK